MNGGLNSTVIREQDQHHLHGHLVKDGQHYGRIHAQPIGQMRRVRPELNVRYLQAFAVVLGQLNDAPDVDMHACIVRVETQKIAEPRINCPLDVFHGQEVTNGTRQVLQVHHGCFVLSQNPRANTHTCTQTHHNIKNKQQKPNVKPKPVRN